MAGTAFREAAKTRQSRNDEFVYGYMRITISNSVTLYGEQHLLYSVNIVNSAKNHAKQRNRLCQVWTGIRAKENWKDKQKQRKTLDDVVDSWGSERHLQSSEYKNLEVIYSRRQSDTGQKFTKSLLFCSRPFYNNVYVFVNLKLKFTAFIILRIWTKIKCFRA